MSEESVQLNIKNEEIDLEFEQKNYWKSCCLQVDRRAVKFFSQLTLSFTIIIFCLYQLWRLPKEDSSEYLSLLTMIIGVYVEAPRLH